LREVKAPIENAGGVTFGGRRACCHGAGGQGRVDMELIDEVK
jgi:hypothetical protein